MDDDGGPLHPLKLCEDEMKDGGSGRVKRSHSEVEEGQQGKEEEYLHENIRRAI